MRLTEILYRQNYHRTIQRVWRRQGKMTIAPVEIPSELKEMGVKIYDALDVAKGKECSNETIDVPVAVSGGKKYYLFDTKVKVTHNETQVLELTKTVPYEGLPSIIQSLIGKESLPDQDKLVQNSMLQALVRDAHQDRLPKKVDVKKPGWIFPREYGIRYKRKAANLMQKLAFLAEMPCGKFPDSVLRARSIDAFTELAVERKGDSVIFQLISDILLASQKPLKPFASPEEVECTINVEVPSFYPVKPTLDLWQSETNPCKFIGIDVLDSDVSRNLHIHTLHIVQKSFGFWFPQQRASRAIATCFAFASEEARRLYGDDVKLLPKPVTVQCIFSDIQVMGFLAYQLNTLDLNDDSGIKNQVWIEPECNLYSEIDELKGITEYNSELFPKMLAFYLNGLHPSSM